MAGSPLKNLRNHMVREAILRGLKDGQDPVDLLVPFADKLKDMAMAGDLGALREVFDRVDGKASQPITGADGGPLQVQDVPWATGRDVASS